MAEVSIAKFILGNLGLLVGLALVLVATWILPARVRWYVLTAGLAVVAFRTYQVISANKRLREADEERERLRGELDDLGKQREQTAEELQKLNNELNEIKTKQNKLAQRAKELDATGNNLVKEKAQFDSDMEELKKEDQALMKDIDQRESALALFNQAEEAYRELERVAH